MPATNATSERSFSALHRVKTYLRTTMTPARLNHLMVLHVHRVETDALHIHAIARDFVSGHENRVTLFGRYFFLIHLHTCIYVMMFSG